MEESNLKKTRIEKLNKLKSLAINPYPASYAKTHTIAQALEQEEHVVRTAGKLFSFREHGSVVFSDLKDETGKIQIFFQKKLLGNQFKELKLLDIGDFIGVEGRVTRTVAGEISIAPTSFTILSKSLSLLPNEWFGLKDIETRYRQRYLDLLLNPEVRSRFNIRTKLISGIREYLDSFRFWEVETPTLQTLYGGANAKPFTTHLRALDQDVYLRIADELYLKRLIVGGYERVYEICKDFRNEGIDNSHFPEFTMIEWYEAYADYHVMMDRAEGLVKHVANKLFGHTVLQVNDKKIDVGKNWPRIEMAKIINDKLRIDVEKETKETLFQYAKKHFPDMQLVGGETKGQLIFAIFEHAIPKLLTEPTWIIDYPQDVSPLSKVHRSKPGWVERFEGYIGGKEIFDGWSELNDPQTQRKMWLADEHAARKDKEEAQHIDEDFLTAMEYGMPPFGGIGVGIDRLTMLFTNTWIIKELILFPTLKREKQKNDRKKQADSFRQDFSKKIVIVVNNDLPQWQVLNTVGHISAYIGNKMQQEFDTGGSFDGKDNISHPRNTQYPIIVLSAKSEHLSHLAGRVRTSGLLYHGFIREMIETTNDKEIEKILSNKTENQIEYLGIGIFGEKEKVDKLTKSYPLWSKEEKIPSETQKRNMTRDEAYKLLVQYLTTKNLIKHSLATEATMRALARYFHEDEEVWGITGLLHDIDYELAQKEDKLNKHGILLFEQNPAIIKEPMAHAIKAHNYTKTNILPESHLDWAITCCDQLTGLIVAAALVHPDKKLSLLDKEFILKRFSEKSFAKGADRETIKLCEEKLEIPLPEFIEITLQAMQGISKELGL